MSKRAPKHFFSKNASVNLPRTRFDMSYVDTFTLTTDFLYPNACWFVLPGDSWNMSVSNFIRMVAPLDVPMMDNLYVDYHFWFVPFRLVWLHSKYFFGEQDRSPESDTDYTIPQITFNSSQPAIDPDKFDGSRPFSGLPQCGSIYDYFGIPIQGTDGLMTGDISINALPLRSYNLIYDDWYRDEQRCEYSYYNIGDTADTADKYFLLRRGKRFDYFTSTLLEPQLGEPVDIPLGLSAPVVGNGKSLGIFSSDGQQGSLTTQGTYRSVAVWQNYFNTDPLTQKSPVNTDVINWSQNAGGGLIGVSTDPNKSGLVADLSGATAATIASLRQAFQMQAYQELQARGGSRYVEFVYNQFSVIQPDILSRPEYLGGVHQRLTVQPIVQNSSTDSISPQGNLTGIMYGAETGHAFTRSFLEHGYIIGIANIYSDLTYFQGLDRHWSWRTVLDTPIPIFANLTDEAVLNKEICLTGTSSDDKVFGYTERMSYAKYSKNTLRGRVRPNAPLTVGQWSLAQLFDGVPQNTSEFIESNTPISRVEAVNQPDGSNNAHTFICNQKFEGNVVRVLPAYADPMKWFMRV